ncbi:DUF4331 domain-containing protein [Enhygromyxa salina]|nr:DUF4331 domain-containing protein [Enhygromyxa salina]
MSCQSLYMAHEDDLLELMLAPGSPIDCFIQAIQVVVPDTLRIDLEIDPGFPNGRTLADPAMDMMLSLLLLDQDEPGQDINTLIGLLNPTSNDVPFSSQFPYLAPPHP